MQDSDCLYLTSHKVGFGGELQVLAGGVVPSSSSPRLVIVSAYGKTWRLQADKIQGPMAPFRRLPCGPQASMALLGRTCLGEYEPCSTLEANWN